MLVRVTCSGNHGLGLHPPNRLNLPSLNHIFHLLLLSLLFICTSAHEPQKQYCDTAGNKEVPIHFLWSQLMLFKEWCRGTLSSLIVYIIIIFIFLIIIAKVAFLAFLVIVVVTILLFLFPLRFSKRILLSLFFFEVFLLTLQSIVPRTLTGEKILE